MPPRLTESIFIEKASKLYNNLYSYPHTMFTTRVAKVNIVCTKHGEFQRTAREHLLGKGCPFCNKEKQKRNQSISQEEALKRCIKHHGNKYDYTQVIYKGNNKDITIICPQHGKFNQVAVVHWSGGQCPKCANEAKRITFEQFLHRAIMAHGDKYEYIKESFITLDHKVRIICPFHGEFEQRAIAHTNLKRGCPACTREGSRLPLENLIQEFEKVHQDKYDYSRVNYTHYREKVEVSCKEHGKFLVTPSNHILGTGCPNCSTIISKAHKSLIDSLKKFNLVDGQHFLVNDWKALGTKELDLYFPKETLGIEVNGLYRHAIHNFGDISRKKNKHLRKYQHCRDKGITLLQFSDLEIKKKLPIVLSIIKGHLGLVEEKIYARKCLIHIVSKEEAKSFLELNHIQGPIGSSINLGLYYEGHLIQLMTFGKSRLNKNFQYELLRLCTKLNTQILGGSSRLFKHFVNSYLLSHEKVISYCDISKFSGEVYNRLGFNYLRTSAPNYWYTEGKALYSRLKFQKHKLSSLLVKFDPTKTEMQNMLENGYRVYFDCGNSVWSYEKDNIKNKNLITLM